MEKTTVTTKSGRQYTFTRTKRDTNGNPRYLVSWLALGISAYRASNATRRAGLKKFNGRSFGGGFVFQSYNLQESAEFFESLGL